MSRSRYEPVPQREEVIDLESLSNYNYNSGLPNSIPNSTPSSAAPSYYEATPSTRTTHDSPPPSFHTISLPPSSPGTPRPGYPNPGYAASVRTTGTNRDNAPYAELWGVAASTTGAQTDVCAASDALATIAHLKARIERLEESLGQMLLDKAAFMEDHGMEKYKGGSCCMTYTDASPALERGLTAAGGNCCVTFRKSRDLHKKGERERAEQVMMAKLAVAAMVCLTVVLIVLAASWGKRGAGSGNVPGAPSVTIRL